MITAKEFNIYQIQASIFTPVLQFPQTKILGSLVSKFSTLFDGIPLSIPLPQDAPGDIPRLTLKDAGEKVKLEIALSRANFFLYQKENAIVDEEEFLKLCLPIFEDYIKLSSAKIGRMALVVVNILKRGNAGSLIAQHFCKDRWFDERTPPENSEVHFHKKFELSGFNVNNWFRCKSGILIKEKVKVIIVEQDINTLTEDLQEKDFDMSKISNFLKISFKKQREFLEIYFPNNNE